MADPRKRAVHTVESLLARTELEDECLVWQGFMQNGAVPMVKHDGKMVSVRKLIAILRGDDIRAGGYWSTTCGNPACVNPEHIRFRRKKEHFVRIAKKLSKDPVAKALRAAKSAKALTRLTPEQVHEIMHTNASATSLAARFGVNVNTIRRRRRGEMGVTLGQNNWLSMLRIGG